MQNEITEAMARLISAVKDIELGRAIHNDRKPDQRIDGPLWDKLARTRAASQTALSAALAAAEAQPVAWFVKDFADGWIFFDNEADAERQRNGNGAMLLYGYQFARPPSVDTEARRMTLEEAAVIAESSAKFSKKAIAQATAEELLQNIGGVTTSRTAFKIADDIRALIHKDKPE
jgi:hypothetical protein